MVLNSFDFAQLVAKFRRQRGMSQGQLAQATRLSRTYIYHLESGKRRNPSPHVAQNIARALELSRDEKRGFYDAYMQMTSNPIDLTEQESTLLNMGDLARLLVLNTAYPAHALDRLWYLRSWNQPSMLLFEIDEEGVQAIHWHLLELIFDPSRRRHFHGWENLARRLVSDFQYNTRTLTHLPEYKDLWKRLRQSPEFRRIASSTYSESRPTPSFAFQIQHSKLGRLTLRTSTTVFSGVSSYSMVSYVPGDQQTLEIFRRYNWQVQE